jgi:large subunit ribosomal protein L29
MKLRELRELGETELQHRVTELTDELFHLRLRRASSQLPNPMKVRETKRELARVLTLLGQRKTGAAVGRSEARR